MCDESKSRLFRPWIASGNPIDERSADFANPMDKGTTKTSAELIQVRERFVDSRDDDSASSLSSGSTDGIESYDPFSMASSYHCQPVYMGFHGYLPNGGLVNPEDTIAAATAAFESTYARHNQQLMFGGYPSAVEEAVKMINQQDAAAKRIKKLRPKKFRCEYCDVAFSNNGQLKGHVRIHTGERPFNCDAEGCGKSFTRNEELTRHKRIHTGLRPHKCPLCPKSFGRKDHLKKHMRTHEHRAEFHVSASGMGAFGFAHGPCPQFHPMAPYLYPL